MVRDLDPRRPVNGVVAVNHNGRVSGMSKTLLRVSFHADAKKEFGEFVAPVDRIDESNPCNCVNGLSGGYKSFFNRVEAIATGKEGQGYRRDLVVTLAKKITKNLNKSYNCAVVVPVKNLLVLSLLRYRDSSDIPNY